jgi:hypothetical protein
MREILRDFGYAQTAPTHIYEDNLACVVMPENPVRRKFSSHIDISRYFVGNMVAAGVIKLVPLRTHLSNNVDPLVSGFSQIYLTVKYILLIVLLSVLIFSKASRASCVTSFQNMYASLP